MPNTKEQKNDVLSVLESLGFNDFEKSPKYIEVLNKIDLPKVLILPNNDAGSISIKNAINSAEKELCSNGRVLVRVSGTEPLIRVMLEGKDKKQIEILANEISS